MPVTIQDAKNNVDKVTKRATKLDKALSKGEKIGYMDGIKIANKSGKVTKILKKSAADAKAVPAVSDADGQIISDKVNLVLPPTLSGLERIVSLQPHFDKLKIAGLVKINLKKMSEAAAAFSQAMIDRAPNAELKEKGENDKTTVDLAFAKALRAYSNSSGGEEKDAEIEKDASPDSDDD